MILCESLEEDFIDQAKILYRAYKAFENEASMLDTICDGENEIKSESSILNDFCRNDVNKKIKNVVDSFLDKYYPINYGDDETDPEKASEVYRLSKAKRQEIEDRIYLDK